MSAVSGENTCVILSRNVAGNWNVLDLSAFVSNMVTGPCIGRAARLVSKLAVAVETSGVGRPSARE
jgi:hypothetical protein